jgi:hypothetical protein
VGRDVDGAPALLVSDARVAAGPQKHPCDLFVAGVDLG